MNYYSFCIGNEARAIKMAKAIIAQGFTAKIIDTQRTMRGGSHRYRVTTYHPTMDHEQIADKVSGIIKAL